MAIALLLVVRPVIDLIVIKVSSGKCQACEEEGWLRQLKEDYGRLKKGTKLCRSCFREVTTGKITPQTAYFTKKSGVKLKHTEPEE